MKSLKNLAVCAVALALTGAVTVKSVEPGKISTKATVRTVTGNATVIIDGANKALKANMELDAGAAIITGPGAEVYLSVNGLSSAVRVQENTTLIIPQMDKTGAGRQADTETTLDLKAGNILGQVKKVAANSSYEIKTPHGVAGIRGTDFAVTVTANGNGQYTVTFTSVTGTVVASAVVNGLIQTKTINGGESWTVGGDVVPVEIKLLQYEINLINNLITIAEQGGVPPVTPPILQIRPQPTGGSPSGGTPP